VLQHRAYSKPGGSRAQRLGGPADLGARGAGHLLVEEHADYMSDYEHDEDEQGEVRSDAHDVDERGVSGPSPFGSWGRSGSAQRVSDAGESRASWSCDGRELASG
jgi:hypothetical protein